MKSIDSLYSPIISVILEQLVTVEESGVKPAHISIAGVRIAMLMSVTLRDGEITPE